MKKIVSPIAMFLFGVIAFGVIMIVTNRLEISTNDSNFWPYFILTALAAGSISISIPGILKANYVSEEDQNVIKTLEKVHDFSLLDKEPTVSTYAAIAVFILVYLFNPLINN